MAEKKYPWAKIKKDYLLGKYKTIKQLGEAYGVPYNYIRKRTANWNKQKDIGTKMAQQEKDVPTVPNEYPSDIIFNDHNLPEDRDIWHKRMWDKLGIIIEKALDEAEDNFFTHDGKIKTKAVADISVVIEKIQKGQENNKEDKNAGQLKEYVDMLANLRQAQVESDPQEEE